MELKVTFRFDAGDSLLACVDKFKDAVVEMAQCGIIDMLPKKERGIARAIVTADEVKVSRRENIFPPVEAPEAPAEPEPVVENKTYSISDVRAAMDEIRKEIEGENYATDTSSEGYKKYHKELTKQFKLTASLFGTDKPSTLPEDKRGPFIEQIKKLQVLEDGTIGIDLPF